MSEQKHMDIERVLADLHPISLRSKTKNELKPYSVSEKTAHRGAGQSQFLKELVNVQRPFSSR